jgi:hypothetical protein
MVNHKEKTPLHLAADFMHASRVSSAPSVVEWLEKVAAFVDRTTAQRPGKSHYPLSDTEEPESEQPDSRLIMLGEVTK